MQADIILIRSVFIVIFIIAGYLIQPVPESLGRELEIPGGARSLSAIAGALLASGIIFFEMRIRRASLKTLIGAASGSILGIIGAYLIGTLIASQESRAVPPETRAFLTLALIVFMAYIGLMVGAAKGDYLDLS